MGFFFVIIDLFIYWKYMRLNLKKYLIVIEGIILVIKKKKCVLILYLWLFLRFVIE